MNLSFQIIYVFLYYISSKFPFTVKLSPKSAELGSSLGGTTTLLFPIVTNKHRLIYDSGSGSANTDTIANIYNSGSNHGVELAELKPALRLHPIIRAIDLKYFRDQGYKLTADDTFSAAGFFDLNNPSFGNLYMWLNNKTGELFEDEPDQVGFGGFEINDRTGIDSDRAVEVYNNFIKIPAERLVKYDIEASSSASYNVYVYKDGELFRSYENLSGDQQLETNTNFTSGTYTFSVECGSIQNFTINSRVSFKNKNLLGGRVSIRFAGTASTQTLKSFEATRQLPDIKVIDFLTGLFKMFNLTAYITDEKEIVVQTLDTYYSSSSNYFDITKHIDKESAIIDNVLPYKQINFSYEDTDSFLAKNHLQTFKKNWGGLDYEAGSKYDGDVYEVELPFAHFKYERLLDVTGGSQTNVQWGWAVDEKQEAYEHAPLLFYPKYATGTTISVLNGAGVASSQTAYFVPSNALYLDNDISGNDTSDNINFNAEINEYEAKPYNKTLFEKYYKTYIEEVFDKQRRLTKVKAYLPVSLLQKLTLNDKLVIFNKSYKINKITTNFETLLSDLELINITRTVDVIIPKKFLPVGDITATADSTEITVDNALITVDKFNNYEGLEIISTNEEIPDDTAISNIPEVVSETDKLVVTPPIIEYNEPADATSTSVFLSMNISTLGKVGKVSKIDEYGFFYSTTLADLDPTSIDTLKADSSVTTITFTTDATNKFSTPNVVNFEVTGLTAPETIYYKFYAITNTDIQFDKGEALGSVLFEKTAFTPTYSNTGNVRSYVMTTEYDSKHSIRIMNDDDTVFDLEGVTSGIFYSKIVPYVLEGSAMTFELHSIYPSGFSGFGGDTITDNLATSFQRGTGYDATNRTQAEAYSKELNSSVGASPRLYHANRLDENEEIFPFLREGYLVMKTNIQLNSDSNILARADDGFYAYFNFNTDGTHSPDSGISAQVINGIVTNIQVYY